MAGLQDPFGLVKASTVILGCAHIFLHLQQLLRILDKTSVHTRDTLLHRYLDHL